MREKRRKERGGREGGRERVTKGESEEYYFIIVIQEVARKPFIDFVNYKHFLLKPK